MNTPTQNLEDIRYGITKLAVEAADIEGSTREVALATRLIEPILVRIAQSIEHIEEHLCGQRKEKLSKEAEEKQISQMFGLPLDGEE